MTDEAKKITLSGAEPRLVGGHLISAITVMLGEDVVTSPVLHLDDEEQLTTLADELVTRYNGAAPSRDETLQQLRNLAKPPEDDGGESASPSRTTQIIELVQARAELFHAPGEETYASIPVGAHHDTCAIESHRFRNWVAAEFYRTTRSSASGQALTDALGTLDAMARYDGPCRSVYLRTAPDGVGGFYLDLADESRQAVHVTPTGVTVVAQPPIAFVRPDSLLPLPVPVFGGSLDALQKYVNVRDDDSCALLKAFMRAAVRPQGPYPVLHLRGERGTAKSPRSAVGSAAFVCQARLTRRVRQRRRWRTGGACRACTRLCTRWTRFCTIFARRRGPDLFRPGELARLSRPDTTPRRWVTRRARQPSACES
jgi:hypothetical protein